MKVTFMPQPNQTNHTFSVSLILCLLFAVCACVGACAAKPETPSEEPNLLPKYGLVPKNAEQRAADDKFIAEMVQEFHGDRKKAAADTAEGGWYSLRQGDNATAMRRFNEAWLLDAENGAALWGMAEARSQKGKFAEALILFDEAEPLIGDDVDFMTDHAKAIAFAGLQAKDSGLINTALNRFSYIHDRAPDNTLNLQNWAILLYFQGDYRTAWEKIALAMATPGRDQLNADFINKLQSKIPHP